MAKGSPKGSGKKGSPDKKSKSDKKKSSPKEKKGSKKSPKNDNIIKLEEPKKLRKCHGTFSSWRDISFSSYRCPSCFIVLDSFQQLMNHECWRAYFLGHFHLGETQGYCCRMCQRGFQTLESFGKHICDRFTAEDVLPISYRNHFKFYIYWQRRIEAEGKYYDTDWPYVCRCIKCGNKFKRIILYILHTCFTYSLLKPIEVKCLKICRYCKFVFITEKQYNSHLPYCLRPDRAFCNDFLNTSFLRTCQQFVIGRHCYDFDLHITNKPLECSDITKKPLKVGCDTCGLVQFSVIEYLYHPCVAGIVIAPADIEMNLVCNHCRCLFLNYESCEKHISCCLTTTFTFLRFNVSELKVALERWVTDIIKNPYLPKRPRKMKCQHCLEIFCDLTCFLIHLCPKKLRFERLLIQPISLSEMYICESCLFIFLTATETVNHADTCSSKPLMIQIHPNLNESLTALEVWSKLPRLLQMEIHIGMQGIHEKCQRTANDNISHCREKCSTICV